MNHCEECKYFEFDFGKFGVCHRYPNYLDKTKYDWCGEFISKDKDQINIEVAEKDIDGLYTFDDTMKACPKGWRLPTEKELDWMYRNKEWLGGFGDGWYWSSSKYDCEDGNYAAAWNQRFSDGCQGLSYEGCKVSIRVVRNVS